jgi:hypothetical protein
MNRPAALLVSMLCAVPALAQTAAPAADALPPLISDLTIRPNDSKLVAAAKATVRNRTTLGGARRGVVIDNAYIRRTTGNISQSSATFTALPTFESSAPATGQQAASGNENNAAERAAAQQRIEALKVEQGLMAQEADQPYGDFMDEDRAVKRLEQIPREIEAQQKQATPQPPQ